MMISNKNRKSFEFPKAKLIAVSLALSILFLLVFPLQVQVSKFVRNPELTSLGVCCPQVIYSDCIGYANSACGFCDVGTHWARTVIEEMTELGVIDGYGDGTFRPDGYVSREEAIKMICCAFPGAFDCLKERVAFSPDYPDIYDRWSTDYLEAVTGIVNGYSNLTFRPADPMIRLDAAMLLLKTKFLQNPVISRDSSSSQDHIFVPKPSEQSVERMRVSSEARVLGTGDDWNDTINLYNAMAVLAEAGIVKGYGGGHMGWGDFVTRAEMCTLIKRVLEYEPPRVGKFIGLNLSFGRTVHVIEESPKDTLETMKDTGVFFRERYPDQYLRARAIYDAVSMNFAYDYRSFLSGEYKSQEYADVIGRGNGVCAGIAKVYVAFARAAGIDAEVVSGIGINPSVSGPHAWVRLRIDNRVVECDPTWGMSGESFFDNFDQYRATGEYDWLEGE